MIFMIKYKKTTMILEVIVETTKRDHVRYRQYRTRSRHFRRSLSTRSFYRHRPRYNVLSIIITTIMQLYNTHNNIMPYSA